MKKRLLAALMAAVLAVFCLPTAAKEVRYSLPEDTVLRATSALVISLGATEKDDHILFEREADATIAPGAMVRIAVGITALQIIEEKGIDIDKTTGIYTEECRKAILGSGLATCGMNIGEEWTIRDLLTTSMITTAADAVQTLSVALCETERAFVQRMNRWATSIGCENTTFGDVYGLESASQLTTVRDMAKMTRQVCVVPMLEKLLSTEKHTVNPVAKGRRRTFSNVNEMLRSGSPQHYAAMAFGRSGYTDRSGRCLASVARADGYEYLVVVAGCPQEASGVADGTSHYEDTRTLYRWAFRNFSYQILVGAGDPVVRAPVQYSMSKDAVTLLAKESIAVVLPDEVDPTKMKRQVELQEDPLSAPIKKNDVYGVVKLTDADGEVYAEVELIASESVSRNTFSYTAAMAKRAIKSPWCYGSAALIGLLIVGYIAVMLVHNYERRQNGNKRVRFR